MKGEIDLKVFYDGKNDVVSIYLGTSESSAVKEGKDDSNLSRSGEREYSKDEAANLILDMIDLLDSKGNVIGFRVFNASQYYDMELLKSADSEELSKEELSKRPNEKVLGIFNGKRKCM